MADKTFIDLKEKILNKVIKKVENSGEPTDIDLYYLSLLLGACSNYSKDKNASGFIDISSNNPAIFKIWPNIFKLIDEENSSIIKSNLENQEKVFMNLSEEDIVWQKSVDELIGVVGGAKAETACEDLFNIIDGLYFQQLCE